MEGGISLGQAVEKFSPWSKIHYEYKKSEEKLGSSIAKLKEKEATNENLVELQITREMKNDISRNKKRVKKLAVYELNTIDEEVLDKINLTEMQKTVVMLKKNYNFRQIEEIYGINSGYAFNAFKQALRKFEKWKEDKDLFMLESEQKKVYKMHCKGKSNKEIAIILLKDEKKLQKLKEPTEEEIKKRTDAVKSRIYRIKQKLKSNAKRKK